MSLRKACRIGMVAENRRPQTTVRPMTAQKLSTSAIAPIVIAVPPAIAINADARW